MEDMLDIAEVTTKFGGLCFGGEFEYSGTPPDLAERGWLLANHFLVWKIGYGPSLVIFLLPHGSP